MNLWIERIHRGILYSFYALFFSVPLVMFPSTFELFEFNKMWTVYAIALVILFLWLTKIIVLRRVTFTRTPLDIPLGLFLLSQLISTIFSLDPHVSFWGYYSRFNGGFLSLATYIFLYYAFASNLIKQEAGGAGGRAPDPSTPLRTQQREHWLALSSPNGREGNLRQDPQKFQISYKLLVVSLLSGVVVALWGLPSHFGKDPTCLVFRGTLDVSCWTEAFHPTIRIFSTLGQPNWLGTYLAILIPIAIAMGIKIPKDKSQITNNHQDSKNQNLKFGNWNLLFGALAILFYVDLLWTRSQSAFLGFWVGTVCFVLGTLFLFFKHYSFLEIVKHPLIKRIVLVHFIFVISTFFIGIPVARFAFLNFESVKNKLVPPQAPVEKPAQQENSQDSAQGAASTEFGGTDSGKIRLIVWRGAIEIFKQNPLFGSGVETFAYAYYKVKPREHNLTSEWDYLYNKAHNEYLNYLATTGTFGLGSYLLIIVWFLISFIKQFKVQNSKFKIAMQSLKSEKEKLLTLNSNFALCTLHFALLAGYLSILISNFFGFSVVIVNLCFFFIPLFFYDIAGFSFQTKSFSFSSDRKYTSGTFDPTSATIITIVGIPLLFLEFLLFQFWRADQKYSLGYNYDKAGEYVQANQFLHDAVAIHPGESLYKDELSVNLATLALAVYQNNNATSASNLGQQAKQLSDEVVQKHPNNVIYFKTRTRVLYSLAQLDPSYLEEAIGALTTASTLAPTDAKILYNIALLYEQTGDNEKTIEYLKKSIELKPNYRDSYYALALYYTKAAKDKKTSSQEAARLEKEAKAILEYILATIQPNDQQSKELLKSLK